MAVQITLAQEGQSEDNIVSLNGSVADAQNTAERINVLFSGLPQGTYNIMKIRVSTSGNTDIVDVDPRPVIGCSLRSEEPKTVDAALLEVFPQNADGDADGAPAQWAAIGTFPFIRTLLNNRWTLDLDVPPADGNVSPSGTFSVFVVASHTRQG